MADIEGQTPDEFDEWVQLAASTGLTLAEFIRRSLTHTIELETALGTWPPVERRQRLEPSLPSVVECRAHSGM